MACAHVRACAWALLAASSDALRPAVRAPATLPTGVPTAGAAASRTATARRPLLAALATAALAPRASFAAEALAEMRDVEFAYRLSYPSGWEPSGKPVKTHLHEALRAGDGIKVGVTVDPVKIESLEQFGTPEQTAERVLKVEEGRDGVKSVTLRVLRAESAEGAPTYYTIEYATLSSRGKKLFCCKYCIASRRLYVLQVQAKLDEFDADAAVRERVRAVAESFRVG